MKGGFFIILLNYNILFFLAIYLFIFGILKQFVDIQTIILLIIHSISVFALSETNNVAIDKDDYNVENFELVLFN